jgi:hypothetical protein
MLLHEPNLASIHPIPFLPIDCDLDQDEILAMVCHQCTEILTAEKHKQKCSPELFDKLDGLDDSDVLILRVRYKPPSLHALLLTTPQPFCELTD